MLLIQSFHIFSYLSAKVEKVIETTKIYPKKVIVVNDLFTISLIGLSDTWANLSFIDAFILP